MATEDNNMLRIHLSIFIIVVALAASARPFPAMVSSGQAIGPTRSNMIDESTAPVQLLPNTVDSEIAFNSYDGGMPFVENVGQFASQVRFQIRRRDQVVWLTTDAIWISFLEQPSINETVQSESMASHLAAAPQPVQDKPIGVNLKLSFVGANPTPQLEPLGRLDTRISYFSGSDPKQWQPDTPVWSGVRYRDLYPGIDLEITSQNGSIVQRLVVRDDADLTIVRLRVEGAERIGVDGDHILFTTNIGQFEWPLISVNVPGSDQLGEPKVTGTTVVWPFAKSQATPLAELI